MINVNDFKTGVTIELDNNIYQVIEFLHVKPGKGPAFVRTKLKNLRTNSNIDHTFNSGIKVKKAIINKKDMQYLYNTNDEYIFMDMETYEQVSINKKNIEEEYDLLTEGLNVELVFFETEFLKINLPDKIEMKVITSSPTVKGNTTSGALKEVVLETNLKVKVPLFIEENDIIIVSSKDKKYDSKK